MSKKFKKLFSAIKNNDSTRFNEILLEYINEKSKCDINRLLIGKWKIKQGKVSKDNLEKSLLHFAIEKRNLSILQSIFKNVVFNDENIDALIQIQNKIPTSSKNYIEKELNEAQLLADKLDSSIGFFVRTRLSWLKQLREKEIRNFNIDKTLEMTAKLSQRTTIAENEHVVLLVGDTGSGKSVLTNFLSGCNFESSEEDGLPTTKPLCSEEKSHVGRGSVVSSTLDPLIVKAGNLNLMDTAGFEGTRGKAELVGMLGLQLALKQAKSCSILFIIEYANFTVGRLQSIIASINQINKFLNYKAIEHADAIRFVITKAENYSTENAYIQIQKHIKAISSGQNAASLSALDFLKKIVKKRLIIIPNIFNAATRKSFLKELILLGKIPSKQIDFSTAEENLKDLNKIALMLISNYNGYSTELANLANSIKQFHTDETKFSSRMSHYTNRLQRENDELKKDENILKKLNDVNNPDVEQTIRDKMKIDRDRIDALNDQITANKNRLDSLYYVNEVKSTTSTVAGGAISGGLVGTVIYASTYGLPATWVGLTTLAGAASSGGLALVPILGISIYSYYKFNNKRNEYNHLITSDKKEKLGLTKRLKNHQYSMEYRKMLIKETRVDIATRERNIEFLKEITGDKKEEWEKKSETVKKNIQSYREKCMLLKKNEQLFQDLKNTLPIMRLSKIQDVKFFLKDNFSTIKNFCSEKAIKNLTKKLPGESIKSEKRGSKKTSNSKKQRTKTKNNKNDLRSHRTRNLKSVNDEVIPEFNEELAVTSSATRLTSPFSVILNTRSLYTGLLNVLKLPALLYQVSPSRELDETSSPQSNEVYIKSQVEFANLHGRESLDADRATPVVEKLPLNAVSMTSSGSRIQPLYLSVLIRLIGSDRLRQSTWLQLTAGLAALRYQAQEWLTQGYQHYSLASLKHWYRGTIPISPVEASQTGKGVLYRFYVSEENAYMPEGGMVSGCQVEFNNADNHPVIVRFESDASDKNQLQLPVCEIANHQDAEQPFVYQDAAIEHPCHIDNKILFIDKLENQVIAKSQSCSSASGLSQSWSSAIEQTATYSLYAALAILCARKALHKIADRCQNQRAAQSLKWFGDSVLPYVPLLVGLYSGGLSSRTALFSGVVASFALARMGTSKYVRQLGSTGVSTLIESVARYGIFGATTGYAMKQAVKKLCTTNIGLACARHVEEEVEEIMNMPSPPTWCSRTLKTNLTL